MTVTPAPKMHNWLELLSSVEENKGVFRADMATLRGLEGRQRVGKHILSAIEEKLASLGLGHLPKALPNRHQHEVVLFKLGTPASEMVQSIEKGLVEPSPPESVYTLLHRLNSMPDPDAVVHRSEVDEAVNQEVGSALEETARGVLKMLANAHPNAENGKSAMGNNGPALWDLVQQVERQTAAEQEEIGTTR